MAYIGNQIRQYSDRVVLDSLTASATANYTLQLNGSNYVPSSAESLTVSLNGVIQKPQNSYTVSGSTLSFASALTASDSIDFVIAERGITLQTPSAGSVNTEQLASNAVTTAKIADANVTSAKMFSGFANGITMADQWRLNATTNISTDADITTNWERNDSLIYNSIGTGLTESSGVFSFPQAGLYLIYFNFAVQSAATDASANINFRATQDNSSYTTYSVAYVSNSGAYIANQNTSNLVFFNVTNITNDKFIFQTGNFDTGTAILGNTTQQRSGFSIIRLGDT